MFTADNPVLFSKHHTKTKDRDGFNGFKTIHEYNSHWNPEIDMFCSMV